MGVKYIIRCHEDEWRTEINVPTYEGESIEVLGVKDKAGEYQLDSDEHIMSSKFNLSFYTDEDLFDLQTCDDLEVSVKVYRNNNIFWSGFLIADGIKQYDRDIKSAVDLIATDGLNLTTDLKFEFPDEELPIEMPTYTSETRTPLHYLIYVLRRINNELPIRWACSTKSMLDETKDALCGVDVIKRDDFLLYKDADCHFILENILKSFNLKMFQTDGIWYIINQLDCMNGFNGYEYVFGSVQAITEDLTFVPDNILTNDAYFEVQKGVGSVKVTYNPIKDQNVIPNGDFNAFYTEEVPGGTPIDRPLYWHTDGGDIYSDDFDIRNISMREVDDFGRPERSALLDGVFSDVRNYYYFESPSLNRYIPVDGHNLYKSFTMSFRMMPEFYPEYPVGNDKEGQIDWLAKPFGMQLRYTVEKDGNIEAWYLNEFGYWIRDTQGNFRMTWSEYDEVNQHITMSFEGYGIANQELRIREYIEDTPNYVEDTIVPFPNDFTTLNDTLNYIVGYSNRFSRVNENTIRFETYDRVYQSPTTNVINTSGVITTNYINLIVDQAINGDVIEFQFQSKANQGRVVMPDPGDIMEVAPDGKGHLTFRFSQSAGVRTVIDMLELKFDDVKETYNLKINDNSKEEFELRISSSFTGFDLTSYMSDFSTSENYMMHRRNGVVATLTEHYGRDYLRLNAKPRRLYSATFLGHMRPHQIVERKGIKFVPLSMTYNTENNETSGQFIELTDNNLDNIEVTISDGKENN